MFLTILAIVYVVTGLIIAAALLTDSQLSTSRRERFLCVITGFIWPIAIGIVACVGLYSNLQERAYKIRSKKREQLNKFSFYLFKMQLISHLTYQNIIHRPHLR